MFFSGEEWGQGRSDSYLRQGVFANDISLETTGGYHYTTGFSMIRYLHTFYGEEKLVKLLEFRSSFKTYSFNSAFKEVYKKEFKVFEEEWRRYIYTYYYGEAYSNKNLISKSDSLSSYSINGLKRLENNWFSIRNFVQNGKSVVILGKKKKDQGYFNLSYGEIKNDSLEIGKLSTEDFKTEDIDYIKNLNISKNGSYITYSRLNRAEYGSLRKTLFLLDIENSEKIEIGRGGLSVISNNGNVYYHTYKDDISKIKLKEIGQNISKTIFTFGKNTQVAKLTYNEEKSLLIYSKFDAEKKFYLDIFDLKQNKILKSIETNFIVKEIIWKNENEIIIATESGKDFKNRIFTVDLSSYELTEFNSPVFNIRPISVLAVEKDLRLLTFGDIYRKNNPIGIVNLTKKSSNLKNLATNQSDICVPIEMVEDNYYTKWITTEYKNKITDNPKAPEIIKENSYNSFKNIFPMMILPLPSEKGITLSSIFMEPLGKHTIILAAYAPYEFDIDKSLFSLNYINKSFYPELSFNYLQYKWLMGINDSKFYYQDIKEGSFRMKIPVDYLNIPFWNLNYSIGFNYKEVNSRDESSTDLFAYEDGIKNEILANINLNYNLPYLNSKVHPIKMFDIDYTVLGSTKDMGMNHNFVHHDINLKLGYAPFYNLLSMDNLSLFSKIKYEWVNGKDLAQDMPGVDKFENIPIEDFFNNKTFLRGNEETINGEKLFSSTNEVWLKLPESMLKPFLPEIFPVSYLGFGGFIDYSFVKDNTIKSEIKTFGWESKAIINLLGVDTEHRFGQVYDFDRKEKIGFYYQANIFIEI